MRSRALVLAAGIVLAGPTILAFRQGGYFDITAHPVAPLVAAAVSWLLVLLIAVAAPVPLPRGAAGRTALAGLALYTAWTGVSIAWAPVSSQATPELERCLLYLAAFVAAMALMRSPAARRSVEPALAAGTVIVLGYALATRFLPGVIPSSHTAGAINRLEQPLTYWNAEAALAGMGIVLCLRILGDRTRGATARALSAAAMPLLGVGMWLCYSRGALAALAVGLLALLILAPSWSQLRAFGLGLAGAAGAVALSTAFPTISTVAVSSRVEQRGATFFAFLVLIMALSGGSAWWLNRREQRPGARVGALQLPRRLAIAMTCLTLLAGVLVIYAASREKEAPAGSANDATPARLTSTDSDRYSYWTVALREFGRHPLEGLGASGFAAAWLRERTRRHPTKLAHSLELQTAADLGAVGLAALALFLGGVAVAARRAQREHRRAAAGWCAAVIVWLLHSALDWDWHMPALTLVAIVLAGSLIGLSELGPGPDGAAIAAVEV
jgi:hypothetical protein